MVITRLLKWLGDGGFAEVYLGEHIHLGTPAAIKVLTTKLAEDEIEQFRNEARTMIGLKHPNVMRVLDFGLAGRIPFIVMDYAPGGSLRTIHPRGTRLPLSTIVNYVKQIAAALQYVHDQRLIHRDVKPENMLLGCQNEVVLSDFGITAVAHSTRSLKTQDGSGTIYYMAPEQIQGKPRPASDQYSLGIVVYEWLCGTRPFNGTYWEVASQHLSASPPFLREKIPSIPPAVEQVVLKALIKDHAHRFPSIQAFAKALEQTSAKLSTGTKVYTYSGHSDPILHITWSPDSLFIASQSWNTEHSLHIWEALTGRILATYNSAIGVTWSPDGTSIAFCGVKPEILAFIKTGAKYSPDDIIDIYDLSVGKITRRCDDPKATLSIFDIAWAPDGKHIAATDDYAVKVWNAATGDLVTSYREHRRRVFALAWLPDGKHIISGGENEDVHLWNIVTGKTNLIYRGHSGYITDVAASPDSAYIASTDTDKTIHVWDAASGQAVFIYRDHRESVQSVTWSLDSKLIASASNDHTVHIWEVPNGRRLFTYPGHTDGVLAVAWSPNGQFIASAGRDKTVQIWQAP